MKTIHYKVPRAIYLAWKKYVEEEYILHPEFNAVAVFCNLPELKPFLDRPIMVIRKNTKPTKKLPDDITNAKNQYNHLNFRVPDEVYTAWCRYLDFKKLSDKTITSRSLFCSLPEIKKRAVNYAEVMHRQRLRGRKPYFIKTNIRKR